MATTPDIDIEEEAKALEARIMNHEAYGKPYDWSLRDFELGTVLGKGSFGHVYVAREKQTGLLVAMKILIKAQISNARCEHLVLREIENQSHLKHPNIVRLLTWFHDEEKIYLVVEYVGNGDLYSHLIKSPKGRFPEDKAAKYIYQVVEAVDYCHQHDVIHRDIKLENLLVTCKGDLKLADFGLSVHAPSQRRNTVCGTLYYMPPEMVKGDVYDVSVDLWCIGILLYELLVGKPPFESKDREQIYAKILSLDLKFPPHVSDGARDLISKLLRHSSDRLPLEEVKSHYWLKQLVNKVAYE